MYLLYSLVLVIWGIALFPFFLYRAWRHHKYLPGIAQRFGRLPESLKATDQPTIWFHACSVGETLSLQPLVQVLHRRFPRARFVFSTITQTGQLMAMQNFKAFGEANTFYFPVDLAFAVRRVLDWIRPVMIVIIDTEIWPNLVNQAHRRGIPVVLANGRISASSFPYYRCARPMLARVLRQYELLMMQSEEDAQRMAAIGAPQQKMLVSGNIKFDKSLVEKETGGSNEGELGADFLAESTGTPMIVAGSTHPGEEQILMDAFRRVREIPELSGTRLLLAPRHPERFNDVAELILQSGFRIRRRTEPADTTGTADILLLDTLGELAAAYRFATVAFVGGSLVRRGGHSIMEPAFYSRAIVTGPSMENFRGIVDEFRKERAIRQISAGQEDRELQVDQLSNEFIDLLRNVGAREALGRNALSLLEKNRGAAGFTADRISSIFEELQMCRQEPGKRVGAESVLFP